MSGDQEDFHHELLVRMARVKAKYDAQGKELTEGGLMLVARNVELEYWHKRRVRLFGLNCSHCTVERRSLCRSTIEPSHCPKGNARQVLSLNRLIEHKNGGKPTELQDLIAGKPTDIDARLDARRILQGMPKKLVKVGYKVYAGIPLEPEEKKYLKRWQKGHPAPLVKGRDHLGERVLEQLHKNPQGLTRSGLADRLHIYVRELNFDLARLIKGQQVVAVKRGNPRGRPPTSLLFSAGASIPEQEFHHDKRTIRRAVYGIA